MLFSQIKNKEDHPDEIMEFVPVSQSFRFKSLQPFLETSEYSFMRTLFSDKVYDQIETYYQNNVIPQSEASGSGTVSGSGSFGFTSGSGSIICSLLSILSSTR